ncbi:hypothetical protein [uncultured Cycloclasticus sp.]|jgi:hypothetical protein|uniref:hypothetical protein n=1 Tax=uncultured Cycloclasticus sp. TaxID=172194 RepID=UPI00259044BE|nr:hypothetical protein [uncultured Cycloclasticus sp.]
MKLNLTETIDDVWNVSSLMLYPHPNDSNKRKDWVEQSKYHNLIERHKNNTEEQLPIYDMGTNYFFRTASFMSSKTLNKQTNNRIKKGFIAGDMLFHVYLMKEAGVIEPSLRKANFIIRNKTYKSHNKKYNEIEINNIWTKYKSVAHLWAALCLNEQYGFIDNAFESHKSMTLFLSIAQTLQKFATTFTTQRSKSPLIALNSLYEVPSHIKLGSFTPKKAELTQLYEKKLKKYKAPN